MNEYEKLDRYTLEWIIEKVHNMIINNFALYCGEEGKYKFTDYGRGKDTAFRDVMNILTSCNEYQKIKIAKPPEITEDERKFLLIGNIMAFLARYRDSDMEDAELAEKILEIVEKGIVWEEER